MGSVLQDMNGVEHVHLLQIEWIEIPTVGDIGMGSGFESPYCCWLYSPLHTLRLAQAVPGSRCGLTIIFVIFLILLSKYGSSLFNRLKDKLIQIF
jgi:hypothetical protein